METPAGSSSAGLRDLIVTLPTRSIVAMVTLAAVGLGGAIWLIFFGPSESVKTAAAHTLVVLLPAAGALIAAVGVRRNSTDQIDHLVEDFLGTIVLKRLEQWCATKPGIGVTFPFEKVELIEPVNGRSYGFFRLTRRDHQGTQDVGIKMNVFNFEVLTKFDLALKSEQLAGEFMRNHLIDHETLSEVRAHPILSHFMGSLQGSVEEGYNVRVTFDEPRTTPQGILVGVHFSFRMKLKENFLTSPFLKRYFSEDAAILVNVIFGELDRSGMKPANVLAA